MLHARTSVVTRSVLRGGAGAASTLVLASLAVAQVAEGPNVNPRAVWSNPPETFTSRVVASGFEDPWEATWGPDGFLWITERVGKRIVRVDPADGSRKVAVSIDDVYQTRAVAPDGRRIYAITDAHGRTSTAAGEMTGSLAHPGALLEFTYSGARASESR